MTTNVLIINRQLVFAVTIKQALEQTGAFEVHPFTSADAALEFIRSHPHDVALIDFTLPDGPGIVRRLRALQPDIAVIVSPTQPNSGVLIRELGLQGMIDAPFSARGIIPLIEHAVEQIEQPLTAITRSLNASDDPSSGETEVLSGGQLDALIDESEYRRTRPLPEQFPSKRSLEDEPPENLPMTRQFADEPDESPRMPWEFSDEPADMDFMGSDQKVENLPLTRPLPEQLPPTRILNEEEPVENLPGTRNLPEQPLSDIPDWLQSRLAEQSSMWGVDEDEEENDKPNFEPPTESKKTRIFDGDASELDLSPSIPEFSTLDSILSNVAPSEMFEPKVTDEDTPAVPSVDSGAVRQFLATKTPASDDVFGSVLGNIPAESPAAKPKSDTFEDLVKSMRGDKTHTPLPDRHQQFIDFILTGGMDNLLTEIEKHKTGPLPELEDDEDEDSEPIVTPSPPPQNIFEKLAEEEPPMPTLEESGTVGDLMLGVSDTGFRNVLAMMQGEEIDSTELEASYEQQPTARDIDQAFRNFFDQEIAAEPEPVIEMPAPLPPPVAEPREESPAIPAQLILETALDESTPIDSFSLGDLITNIERQLSEHTPEIQPPPSWGIPALPRPKQDDRYIKEPDFLPEEFPTSRPIQKLPSWRDEEISRPEPAPASDIDWSVLDEPDEFDDESLNRPAVAAQESAIPAAEIWNDENSANQFEDVADQFEDTVDQFEDSADQFEDKTLEDMAAEIERPLDTGMWDNLYEADEFENENLNEPAAAEQQPITLDAGMWNDLAADEVNEEIPEEVAEDFEQSPVLDDDLWNGSYEPVAADEQQSTLDSGLWDDLDIINAAEQENPEEIAQEFEQPPTLDMGMWDDLYEATVQGEAWNDEAVEADDFSSWNLPPTSIPIDMSIDESLSDETVMMQREDEQSIDLGQMADFDPFPGEMNIVGDDPYIAQIALSLTQVSLELTAEATLLTHESEIVASAGQLSTEEIKEFGVVVNDDWSAGEDESRIRFITLPSNGKGYMLYSRRTAGDFTLSMIFADTTPLKDIRRQGKRLNEALASVPDVPPVPIAAVVDTNEVASVPVQPVFVPQPNIPLTPYSYVWLLRDGNTRFNDVTTRAIRSGLAMQLREQGWQVKNIEAHDEYIYLVADVPGEQPAHEVVNDLKRRVAEIANMQDSSFVPQSMWADSYLIMTPGRELHPDEIDQFIQFERMF